MFFTNFTIANVALFTIRCCPKEGWYSYNYLDLSSHRGSSINQRISSDTYFVKYSSFNDAVGMVLSIGSSCFMAKLDIKHAFGLCQAHPSDWPLLGYVWQNNYFVDVSLPFSSRSS